jgi:EAL domain-containing protein (putative c-di-GMP-specific phosphodiesterase class I)
VINDSGTAALAVAPFMLDGEQLHEHIQRTHDASAVWPGSYAVLAVRLMASGALPLEYQPEADARRVQEALRVLGGLLRNDDRVAVIRPNELIVVLRGLPSPEYAELGATSILSRLNGWNPGELLHGKLRATVGIATSVSASDRPVDLVRHARSAARLAATTTTGYQIHRPADTQRTPHNLEPALRAALVANELYLVFQPQISLMGGGAVAVEALARWNQTGAGPVPPDRFIPLAEQCGLLPRLTRLILNTALRQHRRFLDAGLHVSMAINVSPMDLRERDFCELVEQTLQTWSVSPGDITLEITETAPVHDPEEVVPLLKQLKDIGVQLSIDDFGTGYSSLSLLRQLPVDEIKIDQQFVRGLLASRQNLDIVRTTLALASNFGLRVVAEGIEDGATLDALRDMGCEFGQGFGIARPLAAVDAAEWLRERARSRFGQVF